MDILANEDSFNAQIDAMMENLKSFSSILGPDFGTSFRAAFTEVFTVETFMNIFREEFEKHFSEGDMLCLLAFFQTDVGRRYASAQPTIIANTQKAVQAVVQSKMPLVLQIFDQRRAAAERRRNIRGENNNDDE
jgi:hypothetical protein